MIKKIKTQISQKFWTHYFKAQCTEFGDRIVVRGKLSINGGGQITCGNDLLIRCDEINPVKIHVAPDAILTMGNQVFLNNGTNISCSNNIQIGTHVDIADECLIMDNDFHGVGEKETQSAPIIIEDDVWLASRVIILKGVRIGKGSIVGAGSVVTKSIPPNSFVAGNPAKVIRSLK